MLLLALLLSPAYAMPQNNPLVSNELLLERLDSIIMNQESLVKEKETRITTLRHDLANVRTREQRLDITGKLYDEYLVFDSDSALHYAAEARQLVEHISPSDYDRISYWKLNEAFIHTVQGLHHEALHLLNSINSSRLSPEMKSAYFGAKEYLHSMRAVYVEHNNDMWKEDIAKATAYRDSIQALDLPPASDWMWVPVATVLEDHRDDIRSVNITFLKNSIDRATRPSRHNAINAYWLSRYYKELGEEDNMLRYKTIAAINDALIVNREITALQEIANYLFEKGELNRAYSYLAYTVNQANLYHNRYRLESLSDMLPTVKEAYRVELEQRDGRIKTLTTWLTVVAALLLVCLILIFIGWNRMRKTRLTASTPESPVVKTEAGDISQPEKC